MPCTPVLWRSANGQRNQAPKVCGLRTNDLEAIDHSEKGGGRVDGFQGAAGSTMTNRSGGFSGDTRCETAVLTPGTR